MNPIQTELLSAENTPLLSTPADVNLTPSPPEHRAALSGRRTRRHIPKGHACGWIEERIGNRSRKKPSVSYYYCWDDKDERHRKYIPVRKLWRVQQLWHEQKSVDEIVTYLVG